MTVSKDVKIEASPAYALGATYRMLRRAMDEALEDLHLTTPQWTALDCVARHEQISGAELARRRHVTPQTMHAILQNLEHNGMIVREPHPTQGTVLRVLLTDEGRALLEETVQRAESVQARMLSDLNEDEQATLTYLLERCMRALERCDYGPRHDSECEP